MAPLRIACRIRRVQYLSYAEEFTIRCGRPSGVQTELQKVLSGWGDYILYGFSDDQEDRLATWFVGDLKVFRLWFNQEMYRQRGMPGKLYANHDGSSSFSVFKISELPPGFVVGSAATACWGGVT